MTPKQQAVMDTWPTGTQYAYMIAGSDIILAHRTREAVLVRFDGAAQPIRPTCWTTHERTDAQWWGVTL
jgi:hypothetical protein